MKLRNRKTGEIIEAESCNNTGGCISIYYEEKDGQLGTKDCYTSLAKLNEEWEDYEEPKEYWHIFGTNITKTQECLDELYDKRNKEIGNYFETKEEAEKAVEKLKAWKRLKDKGFGFDAMPALGHCDDEKFDISIIATMPAKWWYNDKVVDDIHYIFGDEQ